MVIFEISLLGINCGYKLYKPFTRKCIILNYIYQETFDVTVSKVDR